MILEPGQQAAAGVVDALNFDTLQMQHRELQRMYTAATRERDQAKVAYWELRGAIGIPKETPHAEAVTVAAKLSNSQPPR